MHNGRNTRYNSNGEMTLAAFVDLGERIEIEPTETFEELVDRAFENAVAENDPKIFTDLVLDYFLGRSI